VSSWIEAVVVANEQIIACERRFRRQCACVIGLALDRRVTAEDEMLLASYMTSLTLIHAHRNCLLAEAPSDA
jgi:hypothetical protein